MTDPLMDVPASTPNRCVIRVLFVADGRIHFKKHENGFSLSEVIEKALGTGIRPFEEFQITTARRANPNRDPQTDPDKYDADCPDFTFRNELFGIDFFDQVWMFGDAAEGLSETEDPPLTMSELEVLSRFMNAGGGVFATGDHMSLGYAMCGSLPRVRSMRKWCYSKCGPEDLKAPGIEATRIDTLREGSDGIFQRSDQSDNIPQEIRPKYFLQPDGRASHPHPLLIDRKGAIKVLPDHAHEGECVIPSNLANQVRFGEYVFEEYPNLGETLIRLPPQPVAQSISAGGLVDEEDNAFPTEPRAYYPIVAYDGHQVSISGQPVGRVVVDSSFHHFLDINLRGIHSGDVDKRGFYDCEDKPTADYESIKEYYRNIIRYLCPPSLRLDYYRALLLDLRLQAPAVGALKPIAEPTYQNYLDAGELLEREIAKAYSRAEALQCALALMPKLPTAVSRLLAGLINPWLPAPFALALHRQNPEPNDSVSTVFEFNLMVRLFLGAAIFQIIGGPPPHVDLVVTSLIERSGSLKNQKELRQ